MTFEERCKQLNIKQMEAVEAIDGPVMVIAGPGTGKTRVLTMRIAKILNDGLSPADGILCLTFTNSGVREMRERLVEIIGPEAVRVTVSTFHSFGLNLIEDFFEELGLEKPPKLLDDVDKVLLYDELLENHEWKYLRRRNGGEHNFNDLKSLISLLKRERILAEDFAKQVSGEIDRLKKDPANISSRGKTKGELKSDIQTKLEALERTQEAARFYDLYEMAKKERNLADYDDVLENIVLLVNKSENVRFTLREKYLYVLVDEHQDSSGVQNEFLEATWAEVEKPNLFVVGDDRQLIYGFGGASLSHFEKFVETFRGTKIIALTENYRSTQTILDVAEGLLKSTIVKEKLIGSKKEKFPIELLETEYPRDEIIRAGIEIKKKIEEGMAPNECAILVPKQAQARMAVTILKDLGLPVAYSGKMPFFGLPETQSFIRLLRVLANPVEGYLLAELLLDHAFGVPFLVAQKFLKRNGGRLSLDLFLDDDETIRALGKLLEKWTNNGQKKDIYSFIQEMATEFFFKNIPKTQSHKKFLSNIEITRTMLHLALSQGEKNPKLTLQEFVKFLDRMEDYNEDIPLAVFSADLGVEVLTLHGSKGREFEFVWIAHMDEGSLMKGKRLGISLPEMLKEKVAKKDEMTARRELYVAITRAKRFCTISYACSGYSGADQSLAKIIAELPANLFIRKNASEIEEEILKKDPLFYVSSNRTSVPEDARKEIIALAKVEFADKPVSVTHLNNFFSCPWKWYFRNFLQLPEPETESLKFGNVIHGAIEEIISDGISEVDKVDDIITRKLDELHIWDEAVRERFEKDARMVLGRFLKDKVCDFKGALSEHKTPSRRDSDFPQIEINGKIDIIKELPDKTLLVADFKTGRIKKKNEIEKMTEGGRMSDMLRQLAMYSYLLRFDSKWPNVSRSQLIFIEAEKGDKDEVYETRISDAQIEFLRKDLKDYVLLLENGKWIDLPCDFKPFGNKKECPYCALRDMIKE